MYYKELPTVLQLRSLAECTKVRDYKSSIAVGPTVIVGRAPSTIIGILQKA